MRLSTLSAALVISVALAPAQTTSRCLSTLFASDNAGLWGGAVYFDVNVANCYGITVTSLEMNTAAASVPGFGVTVYTTPGFSAGQETNASAWTMVSSGTGTSQGRDAPSAVDVIDFALPPGRTGVALVFSNTGSHQYTNGTGVNQLHSNGEVEITAGSATHVPFTGSVFSPRVWNGTICYESLFVPATVVRYGAGCQPGPGQPAPTLLSNDRPVEARCGAVVYAQAIHSDAGASVGVAFTPGLSITLGN